MAGLTAFVTGCGRGVGAAVAQALADRGDRVFAGIYPEPPGLPGAVALRGTDRLSPVPIDVADNASVLAAAALVASRTRHIDILINVAGVLGDVSTPFPGVMNDGDMHRTYDVNALGPLRVMNAFHPLLLGGRTRLVVNISSEAGSIGTCGRTGWFGYCMSKAALNMASAIAHNALRPLGGRVVVMHPGWVRTWMTGELDPRARLTPEESAAGILAQVDRAVAGGALFCGEQPVFIDEKGDPLPW